MLLTGWCISQSITERHVKDMSSHTGSKRKPTVAIKDDVYVLNTGPDRAVVVEHLARCFRRAVSALSDRNRDGKTYENYCGYRCFESLLHDYSPYL